MNSIILNYLLKKFLKTIFIFVLVFYCFGIILNLFEEVEFSKFKCKYYFTFNFNKYLYSKHDYKIFSIYNLFIKHVVHVGY